MRFSALLPCLVILGIATTSSLADAGQYLNEGVTVTSTYAVGSIGGARHSSDSIQYIACETLSSSGYSNEAGCYANDTSNHYLSCITTDPNLVAAAGTVSPASGIYFSADSSGNCTNISVNNASHDLYN